MEWLLYPGENAKLFTQSETNNYNAVIAVGDSESVYNALCEGLSIDENKLDIFEACYNDDVIKMLDNLKANNFISDWEEN